MRYHGTNVVSCTIITGLTQTPLSGTYLSPVTLEHLPDLGEALHRFRDPIVLEDLNVDLKEARIPRSQQFTDLLTEYGLIDLVRHFGQRRRFRNLKTWSQVRQGTVLWSICDYILGTDGCRFELFGIRYMCNFSPDHFALRARSLRRPACYHARYLQVRRAFPLRLPPNA